MRRVFADLHLCLNTNSSMNAQRTLNRAATLGYSLVSVPLSPETPKSKIATLQKMCDKAKIDFASRTDIKPKTHNDLVRQLRKIRRKFEVVCVICENKGVARQAAKDRRVDLLNFPSLDYRRRFFDRSEAELARNGLAAFEVDIKPLLFLEGSARVRLLSNLRRETAIAKEFHVPIVISSGASNKMQLRKPREQAAVSSLLDLNEVSALQAISQNPTLIVRRNRQKLNSKFVAPGISIVKGEKRP